MLVIEKYTLKEFRKKFKISVYDCMGICGFKSRQSWYDVESGKGIIYTNEIRQIANLANMKEENISLDGLKWQYYK